jgi:hypothetical protein
MRPWKYTLDIAAEYAACRRFLDRELDNIEPEGEAIDPAECGRRIAAKIRSSPAYRDDDHGDELEMIADDFEAIEPGGDTEEFDEAMKRLYDWADGWWPVAKLCWVRTDEWVATKEGVGR